MKAREQSCTRALRLWCINSTMDGLPSLARAHSHRAHFTFWLILFSACLALCLFMIYKLIVDFYEFDVTTTDRIVAYEQIEFPVVTFCNENMFLSPRANDFLIEYFRQNHGLVNVSSYDDLVRAFGGRSLAVKQELEWIGYQLSAGVWNDSVRQSLGYSANDTFYSIMFTPNDLNLTTEMEWYFDVNYGNCYRFNSKQSFKSSRLGYGLEVELFTGLPTNYHDYIFDFFKRGFQMEIKNPDNYSQISNRQTLKIQPGKTYDISISKTKSSILPKPYSNCNSYPSTFSSPVVDEMNRLGIAYDQQLCVKAAMQYLIVNKFGCYNALYFPFFNNYAPCLNRSIYDQFNRVSNFQNASLFEQMCPIDCDRVFFEYSISFQSFPTHQWYQTLLFYDDDYLKGLFGPAKPDFAAVESSFSSIVISFGQIAVKEMSEQPSVEFAGLLSNIGGTLGLFIGPSLLSFTEIFELLFITFSIWWSRKRTRQANEANIECDVNEDGEVEKSQIENNGVFYIQGL